MKFLENDFGEEESKEFDIEVLDSPSLGSTKSADSFQKVFWEQIDTNTKRRFNRMSKGLTGRGDAKSQSFTIEELTSYDVLKLVSPPYDLDSLAKLFEKNPAHNAAVTTKAINIVGLGYELVESPETLLKIEQLQQKKKSKDLDAFNNRLKEARIRVQKIIDSLNNEEELTEIMVKIWTDVESVGNGYLEVGRTIGGDIGYLGHVPGNTIRVRKDRDGFIQVAGDKYFFFRNYGDLETEIPLKNQDRANELIHFKKYTPSSTYYGIPDIISALPAVLGDDLSKKYNLDFFENKAVPRYAFITKGVKLSQEAENKLINYFKNELKGKHHGTLYLPLPATMNQQVDAKFEAIENRPSDQSFTEYIKECRQEVLMVHRVPPSKVGVYENTNLAVSRDADRTFKEQVCKPEQKGVEKKLNAIMREISGKAFNINFLETDIVDTDVKSRTHDRYLRTQVMTPNEVRRDIGLPSSPEGENFLPFKPPGAASPNQKTSDGGPRPTRPSPAALGAGAAGRKERGAEQQDGTNPSQ